MRKPLCNGKPERAPHIGNKCFILCWRCTMVVLFAIGGTLVLECFQLSCIHPGVWGIIGSVLSVPMCIDGIYQYVFGRESTNKRRIVTGALFGCGVAMLVFLI